MEERIRELERKVAALEARLTTIQMQGVANVGESTNTAIHELNKFKTEMKRELEAIKEYMKELRTQ